MPVKTVAGIIVAAGSSSRLGRPKQLVLISGEPMLQRAIRIAQESGLSPVFVVLGAHRELIESRLNLADVRIVCNELWQEGLASSVSAGVETAGREASEASGFLLMACDQPRATANHLRKMIAAFSAQADDSAIASVYAGSRGIPAIFPRSAIGDLHALHGDRGARTLLAQSSWPVIDIPLEGGELDIDRPEDLNQIK